ncbi:MAG: outer membrane beta-barrel family protein, partial [Flavitalea sp.]
ISGKVIDSLTTAPLANATVQLLGHPGRKKIMEKLAGENGGFSIKVEPGKYRLEISFQGYQNYTSGILTLGKEPLDLGKIALASMASTLDEVIVQAEKSSMQLSLDKKIFNVGKDLANAGGSAIDILSNIPSVSVDPEGNVKLRGSDGVRILIDGKPSGLVSFKGGAGLQQLPANLIERVEIITNPSARYEAEGMAGIINIVLKKEKKQGFNGSVELISGTPTNLGAAANLNYRHKKINFFINYGIAYRRSPGKGSLYQEVYGADTTFILKQQSQGKIIGFNNNIRGGLDYFFSEKNILTASYLFRRSDATRITDIRYEDYLFNPNNLVDVNTRNQHETEEEPNSEYSLIYKRSFKEKGHEFSAEAKYLDNWESSKQLFTQRNYKLDGTEDPSKGVLQNSFNDESEKHFLLQADYIKPIGKDGKFETGLRSSFRKMTNDYVVNDIDSAGHFTPLPGLDNVFLYNENIHAVYGILGNKQKKISYQAGLRAEWTDVTTTLKLTNEKNPRNYVNLFPSAHFTIDLPKENAMQLSYSRRVRRPFYNDLSPFFTYTDSRNYFSGNPDLNPEFSNVMEVGHIKYLDKGSISSSLYYRHTNGKIDNIRRVSDQGLSISKPENLVSEKSFGAEFISDYSPYKWWKLDLNLNFFHSDIDGSNILAAYKTSTYSWFARQTSRFMLPNHFDIQFRMNYEAPQKTVQGNRKSLYYADLSASKDVFKGNGTINLNVLDIFNTRKSRTVSTGPNFYTRGEYQYRRRQINLTLNYRIKQAKETKPKKVGADE